MAKFYQHLDNGEQLGTVVKLKFIDDVSDDEFILYHFSDGTKYDKQYIATYDNTDAFAQGLPVVELTSPTNVWEVIRKDVVIEKTKSIINEGDGQTYMAPGPDMKFGRDADGNMIEDGFDIGQNGQLKTDGRRIEVHPPMAIPSRVKIEPDENYLLSLHPELDDEGILGGGSYAPVASTQQPQMNNMTAPRQNQPQQLGNPLNQPQMQPQPTTAQTYQTPQFMTQPTSPITANIVRTISNITINVDEILTSNQYNGIDLVVGGQTISLSPEQFIARITNTEEKKRTSSTPARKVTDEDEMLIERMIDRSKKKECTISMDITLELPPKEVYQTIKTVYPDGMSTNFVKALTARIPQDSLRESLAYGLEGFYDESLLHDSPIGGDSDNGK